MRAETIGGRGAGDQVAREGYEGRAMVWQQRAATGSRSGRENGSKMGDHCSRIGIVPRWSTEYRGFRSWLLGPTQHCALTTPGRAGTGQTELCEYLKVKLLAQTWGCSRTTHQGTSFRHRAQLKPADHQQNSIGSLRRRR